MALIISDPASAKALAWPWSVTVPEAARVLRRSPRHLEPYCLVVGAGLAVMALPYAFGSTAALVAFAVFYGLDWVATVPPTIALCRSAFVTDSCAIR